MIERGRERNQIYGLAGLILFLNIYIYIIGWVWAISELDLPFPNGPGKTHSIRASANGIVIPTSSLSVCDNCWTYCPNGLYASMNIQITSKPKISLS